jgi:Delta7-sterol 5-desaturase
VYWVTAGLWHIVIYFMMPQQLFYSQGRKLPVWATFFDQMCLAQSSLFLYAALPILSEYLIENNYTKVYFYIDEIGGWPFYFLYLFLYVVFFEVGIYWMHRRLHENKFLYKYVHGLHHKYNKASTLTPWASIAFNPIDGILQVCAHCFASLNTQNALSI